MQETNMTMCNILFYIYKAYTVVYRVESRSVTTSPEIFTYLGKIKFLKKKTLDRNCIDILFLCIFKLLQNRVCENSNIQTTYIYSYIKLQNFIISIFQ